MRIILLGAPGAGKGTQAKMISKHFQIPHISTGDLFRDHINKGTEIGLQAKSYLDNGKLVPDELTLYLVNERLSKEDCSSGYLLDGFPRNLYQAKIFNYFLNSKGNSIDKVVLIDIPKHEIIERISGRRFCTKCGSSYHIKFNPSKLADKCEACGGTLIQRTDDNEEVVLDRLTTYYKTIKPIVDYYSALDVLYKIHGGDTIDDVFSTICDILEAV